MSQMTHLFSDRKDMTGGRVPDDFPPEGYFDPEKTLHARVKTYWSVKEVGSTSNNSSRSRNISRVTVRLMFTTMSKKIGKGFSFFVVFFYLYHPTQTMLLKIKNSTVRMSSANDSVNAAGHAFRMYRLAEKEACAQRWARSSDIRYSEIRHFLRRPSTLNKLVSPDQASHVEVADTIRALFNHYACLVPSHELTELEMSVISEEQNKRAFSLYDIATNTDSVAYHPALLPLTWTLHKELCAANQFYDTWCVRSSSKDNEKYSSSMLITLGLQNVKHLTDFVDGINKLRDGITRWYWTTTLMLSPEEEEFYGIAPFRLMDQAEFRTKRSERRENV